MNTVLRLLAGLSLLLSVSVLTAWAWDKSDAQDSNPPTAVEAGSAKPAD